MFQSFILYQAKIKKEFESLSERHGFLALDGEGSVASVNNELRKRIAAHLGIQRYPLQAVRCAGSPVALRLRKPIQLAAIDAGSNAFRLMIARIRSTDEWEIVESVRAPVRLGHSAFTSGEFDRKTLRDAAAAFREFRHIMDAHGVTAYRAVTTSAAREARNRHVLIERIRHLAKIDLEIISGQEEARLVRVAVLRALRNLDPPRFILDLGGGSLELNELRRGVLQESIGLPLGTVRLMEAFRAQGVIHENTANEIRLHVLSVLQSALPGRPSASGPFAVACGGNAETLAGLASGPRVGGFTTLNPRLLRDRLWQHPAAFHRGTDEIILRAP